jgi:hypothetical protein
MERTKVIDGSGLRDFDSAPLLLLIFFSEAFGVFHMRCIDMEAFHVVTALHKMQNFNEKFVLLT